MRYFVINEEYGYEAESQPQAVLRFYSDNEKDITSIKEVFPEFDEDGQPRGDGGLIPKGIEPYDYWRGASGEVNYKVISAVIEYHETTQYSYLEGYGFDGLDAANELMEGCRGERYDDYYITGSDSFEI